MGPDDLLPPDDGLVPLHTREYQVRSYRLAEDRLLLRGAVRDRKPAGMYVEGDPDPLTIHHMVVELEIVYPALVIEAARVLFETHPHRACPTIADHYGRLVGLSIARGFTHKVRELFGGPRGCTHTTALLQAMAPVAIQSNWSMRVSASRDVPVEMRRPPTPEERKAMFAFNLNTCHIWAEGSEHSTRAQAGEETEIPLWIEERLRSLGRDPSEWRTFSQG
ncbi:MAG: DUF2889 domain-containing protein [Acidimicrobiales bacterium]